KTRMSPSTSARSEVSAGVGWLRYSSSSAMLAKPSGSAAASDMEIINSQSWSQARRRRGRHAPQGGKIHARGNGKAGAIERGKRQLSVLELKPRRPVAASVQVGVCAGKLRLLGLGRERHAIDEVMAVALDVCQSQQRCQRQVLLQADAGKRGQV